MFHRARRLFLLLAFLFLQGTAVAWELESGQQIRGEAVKFDFAEKTLGLRDAVTGKTIAIEVEDLSLESRQRLLFSKVFHEGYPTEKGWPDERYYLLRLAVFSPLVALFIGFWVAGMALTGKANPLRAFLGFAGGWMIGGIFLFFYLYFAGRFGGGLPVILVGVVMGIVFLSLYISAIYSCRFGKALLIFILQIFTAAFLCLATLVIAKVLVPLETRVDFWNEHVFVPIGMMDPPPSPSGSRPSGPRPDPSGTP